MSGEGVVDLVNSILSAELLADEYTDGDDISVTDDAHIVGESISLSSNEVTLAGIDMGILTEAYELEVGLAMKNEEE